MTELLAVLGLLLVVGVWAIYVRIGIALEVFVKKFETSDEQIKKELAIVWVSLSSDPQDRAERIKEYGLAPLYNFDEGVANHLWPYRQRYSNLKEEYEQKNNRRWDSSDAADQRRKEKELEELRLEIGSLSASLSPEEKVAWDKISKEKLEKDLERYKKR